MTSREFFSNDKIRAQALSDLAEIISIPSVASSPDGIYPYGRECAIALDKAKELAEKYGFTVENHDYRCMSVLYGDSEKEVGIVCHLDVVPAGDGWSVDPFMLTVSDNLLIGRGTHDDKGPFIQSLYVLRYLKENNIKLPFTVRLILGSDEEVGCTDLDYFVSVRKPPMFSFTPDSEFPVCIGEKSILALSVEFGRLPDGIKEIKGGTVSNAVPGSAYAIVETDKALPEADGITVNGNRIEAKGKSAHAAMPEGGVSAINVLISYLIENGLADKDGYFGLLEKATSEYLGKTLGIDETDKDFGYLTCVGGIISTVDGSVVQDFNIRHIPYTSYEEIAKTIEKTVAPYGGKVTVGMQSEGYFVNGDDAKIKALTSAYERVIGEKCEPYTTGGGTYARHLPNTVAFGSAIPSERSYFDSERGNAHQRDEYMSVKEFYLGMEIYSEALGNLSEIL